MDNSVIQSINPWILLAIVAWTVPWKGIALWKAAQLSHRGWFIAILILNTLGILDIIYIFFVAKKYTVETIDAK